MNFWKTILPNNTYVNAYLKGIFYHRLPNTQNTPQLHILLRLFLQMHSKNIKCVPKRSLFSPKLNLPLNTWSQPH